MINMSHDGNDRRTIFQKSFILCLFHLFLKITFFYNNFLVHIYIPFHADKLNCLIVQRGVDGNHCSHHEQQLDNLTRIAVQLFCQLSYTQWSVVCDFLYFYTFLLRCKIRVCVS